MSDTVTQLSSSESEQETILSQLFQDMQRINAQMRDDQADIERLKLETRVTSTHSGRLLQQIEAQLNALRKAA